MVKEKGYMGGQWSSAGRPGLAGPPSDGIIPISPCLGASRESDGGSKVEQLRGWSHTLRIGKGGDTQFRCVSAELMGVLPGNP